MKPSIDELEGLLSINHELVDSFFYFQHNPFLLFSGTSRIRIFFCLWCITNVICLFTKAFVDPCLLRKNTLINLLVPHLIIEILVPYNFQQKIRVSIMFVLFLVSMHKKGSLSQILYLESTLEKLFIQIYNLVLLDVIMYDIQYTTLFLFIMLEQTHIVSDSLKLYCILVKIVLTWLTRFPFLLIYV